MRVSGPERNIVFLIVSIGALSGVAWLTNAYPPTTGFALIGFFILLALALFSILFFATLHPRRSAFITTGIILTLFLRALNLRHPLYVLMLTAILIMLDVTIAKFAERS